MDYRTQYQIATDPDFIRTVQMAAARIALDVVSEAANTPNHANRSAYATKVLNSPSAYAPVLAQGVCAAEPTMRAQTQDQAIYNALSAVWDAFAGKS